MSEKKRILATPIRFEPELKKKLIEIAKQKDRSLNNLVNIVMREYANKMNNNKTNYE